MDEDNKINKSLDMFPLLTELRMLSTFPFYGMIEAFGHTLINQNAGSRSNDIINVTLTTFLNKKR